MRQLSVPVFFVLMGCMFNSYAHQPAVAELSLTKLAGKTPVRPRQSQDLWRRLTKNYALPSTNHRRIRQQLRYFSKRPDYFQRVQDRARPFLHEIVDEVENSGLPGEIALLPIVESAFRTQAYSRSHAAGIWQFISSTGGRYGLKQSWWYDGRRDVYASTKAAIKHLKRLHRKFHGDWMLALAAYNSGAGKVARAIKKNKKLNKPTNFWALTLPKETRHYVPQLLAIAKIFANPDKYGIIRRPIPNATYLEPIDIGSQLDLALAAKLADIPINDIYRFNPGFNRWATDPGGPHRLLIPMAKSRRFKQKLARLPEKKRMKWRHHKIRRNETLGHIANRYKTNTTLIRQTNNLKSDNILVGKTLLIPLSSQKLSYYKPSSETHSNKSNGNYHRVRRGDTLWDIAKAHSIGHKNLAAWNSLSTKDHLLPGQQLLLKPTKNGNETTERSIASNLVNYIVKEGDSLSVIAYKFKVKLRDLKRWNATKIGKYIQPGQILMVYISGVKPTT